MMYTSYVSDRNKRPYVFSLVFFILALMSKPMAVSLPLVLLILDWYPFGRFGSLKTFRTVFIEKLPFIVMSLASSIVTVFAQRAGNALASMEAAPMQTRVLVGFKALIVYLWKMVLPVNLIPFYPYPKEPSLASLEYLSAMLLVMGITIACIVMAKRQKLSISVWGCYVIMLIPVLGIVQVGQQSMADRYTYLPSLGPFLLMGVIVSWVWDRTMERGSSTAKLLAVAVSACLIISLAYLTIKQTGIWKSSIVFWSYVIEKETGKVPVAYYNRGIAFDKMGMSDQAIADYDEAIALKRDYYDAYNNRGLTYEKKGLFDKAITDLETAMAMKPSSPEAFNNLGKIYRKTGQFDSAIKNYNRAIALKPSYDEAYFNRAIVYEKTGQFDRAVENYNRAIALNPSYYEAYNNLGVLYGNTGSVDKAIEHFSQAILLNQSQSGPYLNRGILYAKTGRKGRALSDFQRACELDNRAGCSALEAIMRGQAK
jgi:tetratricopeptide (TPR) repeat protein